MKYLKMIKQMSKLLLSALIVVLPAIALWLYIIYGGMYYLDPEYPYEVWNKEFCQTDHNGNVDVLFLGDSAVNAAVLPENLSDGTYNLSLGGRTSVEAYYILKEFLKNNEAPDACYIGFADTGYLEDLNFYTRTLYFHRLSYEDEKEIFDNAIAFNAESILKENYEKEWKQYRFWSPEKYLPALFNGGFNARYESNLANYELIKEHKGSYMSQTYDCEKEAEIQEYTSFPVNEFYDFYMKKLLDLCTENNITPRVIMIPMSPNIQCSMDYIADCYIYLVSLQEYCPQMTYFYRPEGFDYNDFSDYWHMNLNGATKYTAKIKEAFPEDFD